MSYLREMQIKELARLFPIGKEAMKLERKIVEVEDRIKEIDKEVRKMETTKKALDKLNEAPFISSDFQAEVNKEIKKIEDDLEKLKDKRKELDTQQEELYEQVGAKRAYLNNALSFLAKMNITYQEINSIPIEALKTFLYFLWLADDDIWTDLFVDYNQFLTTLYANVDVRIQYNQKTQILNASFKEIFM